MCTRNRNLINALFLFVLLTQLMSFTLFSEVTTFVSAKGLSIKILKSNAIGFIHAEILIFYPDKINPAISYLTVENMFNPDIHNTTPNLLSVLKRMGNDFQIEHRVDYLKISLNFLPGRISLFTQFLDELFRYKSFGLKRYNDSISNYRRHFMRKSEWEKAMARQYAYSHLFPDHALGNTVIDADSLLKINLAQIRSFYRNTFRLGNSLLLLKGDLNPHITFGMIEKDLKSFKKAEKQETLAEELKVIDNRKIIVLDVASNESPTIFWFQAIPSLGGNNHMLWTVMNNILFNYPIGVVYKRAALYGIRNIRKIETEVINHYQVSVLCNTIKINYSDIERFIMLVDSETRKLTKRKIDRKEYLDSLNFFLGQAKVNSSNFNHDVQMEIKKSILNLEEKNIAISPNIFQKVTLDNLNRFIGNFKFMARNGNHIRRPEIIVITGNARLIKGYLNILKPDFIYSVY